MEIDNLREIYDYLVPGCVCQIWGNDPERTIWQDQRREPTMAEIMDAQPAVAELVAARELESRIAAVEEAMHAYVRGKYNSDLQIFLLTIALKYIADIARGQPPTCTPARIDALEGVWAWVQGVVAHFEVLVAKMQAGADLEPGEDDWPALFDATDPGITLRNLPA